MKLDYPKATSIDNAIPCGQWGKNNVPIYHLQSATALNQLVGYVKFKNGSNGTVLYRGQGKDYNTLSPSGCRESSIAVSDAIISAASSKTARWKPIRNGWPIQASWTSTAR